LKPHHEFPIHISTPVAQSGLDDSYLVAACPKQHNNAIPHKTLPRSHLEKSKVSRMKNLAGVPKSLLLLLHMNDVSGAITKRLYGAGARDGGTAVAGGGSDDFLSTV
jgi:hypothetical protein